MPMVWSLAMATVENIRIIKSFGGHLMLVISIRTVISVFYHEYGTTMKIKWQPQGDSETYILLEGENSGYPIGVCKRILGKRGFKWTIQPWFATYGLDPRLYEREFEDDIEAGRVLAQIYMKLEGRRKILDEERRLEETYFGDIMPFTGSD